MQRVMNRLIKRFNKISISKKITLIYSLFFIILLVSMSAFLLVNAWWYYGKVSRDEIEETADKIVSYIEQNGEIDRDTIDELNPNHSVRVMVHKRGNLPRDMRADISEQRRAEERAAENVTAAESEGESEMTTSDRRIRRRNRDNRDANGNDVDFFGNMGGDIGPQGFKNGEFNNKQYIYAMRLANYKGEEYEVRVFRSQDNEMAIMRVFVIVFLAVNAFAVLLSIGIGRLISKKMLKPIREMTDTAASITAEDLNRRVDVPEADDEFRRLAVTFNNMFDRLEDSFEKQKRFVSDASHELRTPIAVIQGYANLIDRWGKSDTEVLEESIASMKSETEHMSILINQLLFLAREDNETTVINKENINLWDIAQEAASECELTHPDGSVVCTLTGDKNADVYADSHLMKQLLRIIMENSVKYTKESPCKIDITLDAKADKVLLCISDNGIGIPKEDIEQIFDRFFRSDKSRNKQIPGNGLGLSIAYSIVKNHNGKIWAESEGVAGKGTTFCIELNKDN